MSMKIHGPEGQTFHRGGSESSVKLNAEADLRLGRHNRVKAGIGRICAAMLAVVLTPVILITALLVKLTSRGPAFYCQTRLGKGGRPFKIIKIRTMFHDVEANTGAQWSMPGDPRVTWLGRFLRWTHLDELPQIWNVLRGEMSLVGPRPERPEFVPALARQIPDYLDRLLVPPGVTGLAQIQLPADTDLKSVRRKLERDRYYVQHRSLWLDLRIVLCTVLNLLGIPGKISQTVLCVPRCESETETPPQEDKPKDPFPPETATELELETIETQVPKVVQRTK